MTARPWWATPEDAGTQEADPVTAHRRARRGGVGDPDEPAGTGQDGAAGHDPEVCGVCPWCAGLRALAASHPEAVAHLTEAARHLTQAVRAVVGDLHRPADDRPDEPVDEPVEHIDLD